MKSLFLKHFNKKYLFTTFWNKLPNVSYKIDFFEIMEASALVKENSWDKGKQEHLFPITKMNLTITNKKLQHMCDYFHF